MVSNRPLCLAIFLLTFSLILSLYVVFIDYPSLSSNISSTSKFIHSLYPNISTSAMKADLKEFSSFRTRYYKSSTGEESGKWLEKKVAKVSSEGSIQLVGEEESISIERQLPR